jgi:hypothetical protein
MIVVIDNFIQDPILLQDIEKNLDDIFRDPGEYKWWNGWWNSGPVNITQRIIEYVWKDNCPVNVHYSISGIEYWTGIQSCATTDDVWQDFLVLHKDKDEELWRNTEEIVSPEIGTIYYPPGQDFDGGELEIYSDGKDSAPEVLKAKDNRLIIFPAGEYYHRVNTVTRGIRRAIAFNLWDETPTGVASGSLIQERA